MPVLKALTKPPSFSLKRLEYTRSIHWKMINTNKIRRSFPSIGTPYANAELRLFHISLSTTSYSYFEEANGSLFSYIEVFYNQNQIYKSINCLTPKSLKVWKNSKWLGRLY